MLGLAEADDLAIWEFARREQFAIVTKDADFGELALLRGFPPKIVMLNLGNVASAVVLTRLLAASDALREFMGNTTEGVLEID